MFGPENGLHAFVRCKVLGRSRKSVHWEGDDACVEDWGDHGDVE